MKGKASQPGVNAIQRQLMQYLRGGDWILMSRLPPIGERTLNRMADNGWIERRGGGPRAEIRLTADGLTALQAPI